MNKVILIGNLTRNPELKATSGGKSVATFSLAVGRRFKPDETDYLNIVVWGTQAENCSKYLKKGSMAAVCGSIQTRTYDKNGNKVYVTEIVAEEVQFLSKGNNEAENNIKTDHEMFDGQMTPAEDEEVPF